MTFTGSIYELKHPIKVWKTFRFSLEKYIEANIIDFASKGETDLILWERKLRKSLSVQLPKKLWHKRRPVDNPFPHKNTGKLQRSVTATIKINKSTLGNITLAINAIIYKHYAYYTNEGLPGRKDDLVPEWVDWVYDVFYGDGRMSVPSVRDIFTKLIEKRELL